jgi:hypothetical protein
MGICSNQKTYCARLGSPVSSFDGNMEPYAQGKFHLYFVVALKDILSG